MVIATYCDTGLLGLDIEDVGLRTARRIVLGAMYLINAIINSLQDRLFCPLMASTFLEAFPSRAVR